MTAFLLGVLVGILGVVALLLLAASRWESVTVAKTGTSVLPPPALERVHRVALLTTLGQADNVLFAVLSNGKAPWREWRQ